MRRKNRRELHDFQATGGPLPEYLEDRISVIPVTCSRCGEERQIMAPIAEVNLTGGCVRKGPDKLMPGDEVVTPEGYLQTFVQWLPNGKVLTLCGGNTGYHEWDEADLAARQGIGPAQR